MCTLYLSLTESLFKRDSGSPDSKADEKKVTCLWNKSGVQSGCRVKGQFFSLFSLAKKTLVSSEHHSDPTFIIKRYLLTELFAEQTFVEKLYSALLKNLHWKSLIKILFSKATCWRPFASLVALLTAEDLRLPWKLEVLTQNFWVRSRTILRPS